VAEVSAPEAPTEAYTVLAVPADGIPDVVDTPELLATARAALRAGAGPLAIDTERAQGYRYSAKAYLIQLRRAGASTHLIDPTAFEDGQARADFERSSPQNWPTRSGFCTRPARTCPAWPRFDSCPTTCSTPSWPRDCSD